jgi:hypothetical protein
LFGKSREKASNLVLSGLKGSRSDRMMMKKLVRKMWHMYSVSFR